MHELAITRNIVAIVGEAAQGRRVRRVIVEIGRLSGVMPDAVSFCFDAVTPGTALDGAELDIHEIEARARCLDCATEFAVVDFVAACVCGSRRTMLTAGEELNVKAMEVDDLLPDRA
jgi:hydrogenase nickel incorporation protein HypA/HybF